MAYYHGTVSKGVKVLKPRQPLDEKGRPRKKEPKAVFFSPEVYGPEMYALLRNRGGRVGISYVTDKNKFVHGVVVTKGPTKLAKKGYIYTPVSNKGIVKNPKATNQEIISHNPVHVAFYKEVNRQDVLGRGWTIKQSRFPNLTMAKEVFKQTYKYS